MLFTLIKIHFKIIEISMLCVVFIFFQMALTDNGIKRIL
ncbi:MAG: hypothetical protein JWM14_3235 [Chitinophagaceae bacterium]|nr:hypothetical protein [Chitinophagaceae bacterium]